MIEQDKLQKLAKVVAKAYDNNELIGDAMHEVTDQYPDSKDIPSDVIRGMWLAIDEGLEIIR